MSLCRPMIFRRDTPGLPGSRLGRFRAHCPRLPPRETVHWVVDAVERNEYKRRQAALILGDYHPIWGGPQRQMPVAAVKNLGEVK